MAWCQKDDKPLPDPILTHFTEGYVSPGLNELFYCLCRKRWYAAYIQPQVVLYHWPDVTRPWRGQLPDEFCRECDSEDILRESFGSQHGLLLSPVPDGQHEVRRTAHRRQQFAIRTGKQQDMMDKIDTHGLVHDCSSYNALVMELLQFY